MQFKKNAFYFYLIFIANDSQLLVVCILHPHTYTHTYIHPVHIHRHVYVPFHSKGLYFKFEGATLKAHLNIAKQRPTSPFRLPSHHNFQRSFSFLLLFFFLWYSIHFAFFKNACAFLMWAEQRHLPFYHSTTITLASNFNFKNIHNQKECNHSYALTDGMYTNDVAVCAHSNMCWFAAQ